MTHEDSMLLIPLPHCVFGQPHGCLSGGVCIMASSLAALLHTVGFEMPHVTDVVPLLNVDGVVDALTITTMAT